MEEHRNDASRPGEPEERQTKEPGEVLGVSRPPVQPTAEEFRQVRDRKEGEDLEVNDEPEVPQRDKAGARDVTKGTTGGTGPDTGGSGALRGGSGATGTDIGR